ncbi:MAG TPA: hypothetical protein G4N98_00095 [Thermoflexia bacterium]|nr:hypothetical protein [Thermoflexia bacterium]
MPTWISQAIRIAQSAVHWKLYSAARHLYKRKRQGHLSHDATLEDYERIILTVLNDGAAQVYLYWYNRTPYMVVVATVQNRLWLVMFNLEGVLETAFVIDVPDYLKQPGFEKFGSLSEVEYDKL